MKTSIGHGLTGFAFAAGLGAAGSAWAQSTEDLQRQIDALQRQIEELKAQVESANETAERAEQASEAAAKDEGPFVEPGNDRIRLSLSGQVNRGLLITDDGEDTDLFHVDNDHSSTRVRFIGEGELDNGVTVGTNIEVQFESNSTAAVSQDAETVGPDNFTERKLELFFGHPDYGLLSVGQGDVASNSTSEVDLSGTTVIGYSGIVDFAGGIQFRDGDGELSGTDIGDTFSNLDGFSRLDRLRYDTPRFGGFMLSASAISDGLQDVALRFNRAFGDDRVAAGFAYGNGDGEFNRFNGSVSWLAGGGLNLTFAGGVDDTDEGSNPYFVYGKIGYQLQEVELGTTALAVDAYYGENFDLDGDESFTGGLYMVQNITEIATELYMGGRVYDVNRDGEDFDEIFALLTGARVRF